MFESALLQHLPASLAAAPRAIVAIPVRNEEDRIAACLNALIAQKDTTGRPMAPGALGIVLLLNNCSDRTATIARSRLVDSGNPFALVDVALPPAQANAGFARRMALDVAAIWLKRTGRTNGVLLTTDADSRVPSHWLARTFAAIETGAGAVAGQVALDPSEADFLPEALKQRRARETAYEQALLELRGLIDPTSHDPWPNHWTASGASYALTQGAYHAIGGLPFPASGEDQALTAVLLRHDIPIRHDPDIVVVTSARLEGRARGGVADTMRMQCQHPDTPGDEKLEALPMALRRFTWRRRLRRWHATAKVRQGAWRPALGLPRGGPASVGQTSFGALWADIEATSPRLARIPLHPSLMPLHIRAARALLAEARSAALIGRRKHRGDRPAYAAAGSDEQIVLALS